LTGRDIEPFQSALEIDALSVAFGGLTAIDNVSLAVSPGEHLAIIGPNGAGKTTLFRAISGEQKVDKGRVSFLGADVTRLAPHRRAQLGLGRTYQVTSLFPDLSVAENIALALLSKSPRRFSSWAPIRIVGEFSDRIDEVLASVHLGARRDDVAEQLSHGEQRQLEIGLALASDPQLLLLDEPGAGLSASERAVVGELIIHLPEELTLLIIEHDVDLAFRVAQRVICMDHGAIIDEGKPAEIRESERVQAVYLGTG